MINDVIEGPYQERCKVKYRMTGPKCNLKFILQYMCTDSSTDSMRKRGVGDGGGGSVAVQHGGECHCASTSP